MKLSQEILFNYWGYESFRPLQEDIADSVINGKDVLALLPTGGGKSICFQVPGIAREGLCLVISPLIALMNDQVEQLNKRGIRAQAITSGMSYREIDIALDQARFGGLKFLYTSPERLQTTLFKARFKLMQIALIVVDEAHCISEWGHDFRPPYRKIAELREVHPEVPIIALTATATQAVKDDIIAQLHFKNAETFVAPFERPNISYEVYEVDNKMKAIGDLVRRFPQQSGIIYCQTRRSVKELSNWLQAQGIRVGYYHGGMDKEQRESMMKKWLNNNNLLMVATNAFGMGIDKADVRFVAHYEFPNNPEAYFQEAGRAGRDGKEARTFVFYERAELDNTQLQVERQFPEAPVVKNCYRALCNHLKIAIGSGFGESYPLSIQTFCKQFKMEILETYQALKILEMNGNLLFSEHFFHPTKIKYLVGNTALYSFQIKYDKFAHITTLLSRSYPGIFEQFATLNEAEFCKRLKISPTELEAQLKFLEQNGIIEVNWKTDLPLVTFLHERLPDDQLTLNPVIYHERKTSMLNRWIVMRKFLSQDHCRAQYLISYFGQSSAICGKCDWCRKQGNEKTNIKSIKEQLIKKLEHPKKLVDLKNEFDFCPHELFQEAYDFLILEEVIRVDQGLVSRI